MSQNAPRVKSNWRTQPMAEALKERPKAHPILTAMSFIDDTKAYGGASMNVHTGELASVGSDDIALVGGEKDTSGQRIPTTYYGKSRKASTSNAPDIALTDVLKERARVKSLTGGRKNVFMGSYISHTEPHKGVQIDASAGFTSRLEALHTLRQRNEEAAFDLKTGENLVNPQYNPEGDKK